jgi:hypothetical protein
VIAAAASADLGYHGLDASDVSVVNLDDDQPITVFSDSFEVGEWNGLWVEDSQNDWFRSTQRATDGSYSAEVDGRATNATLTMANPVDLTPYGGATLSFSWFIESGLDSGEYVALDLFDGTTWNEVATLRGNVDQENVWHQETIQIDGSYLVDDFNLRFRAKASRSNEDANVDNVQLIATSLAGPPNQAPTITTSAVATATENLLYTYDIDASDPDVGDTLTFFLDAAPSGMTVDSNTGVIQWMPSNAQVGSNPVTARVQDAGGLFDTQSFNVAVSNVNDSPTITSSPVTAASAESLYSYDVDAADPDAGDTLTFSLDAAPSGMTIDSVSGSIGWTPTSAQVGAQPVTVRVQDAGGLSDTQSFSIDVAAVNHAPAITSTAVTAATEDTLYSYDVTASDTDPGDTLTFSLDDAPSGMTVNSASGLIQWTPTNGQVGSNSVTVRVEDAAGAFDTQSFSVTVANTNDAPSITSTPVTTATEDAPYSYDVQASDPDVGDTLTFSLVVSPTGMSINSSTGMIAWTPTSTEIGPNSVTVRAQDNGGLMDQQEFTISVSLAESTKFFVVDSGVDQTFEYEDDGSPLAGDTWSLDGGNTNPKGATSITDGSKVWVVDNNDKVYVYNGDGALQTSWTAGGLNRAEGIATDGTDIWIVDKRAQKVLRYDDGSTTGDTGVDFSFSLDGANSKAKGITTDGSSIWIVNDDKSTDKVFKYDASNGALLGSWIIDSANSKPTGITIDPSGASSSIWIVDAGKDRVYEYGNALDNSGGSLVGSFALAGGNTNPQGIADPPPASSSSALPTADLTVQESNDKAPISLFAAVELDASRFVPNLTTGNKFKASVRNQDHATINAPWQSAPPTHLPPIDSRDALFARYGSHKLLEEDPALNDEVIDSVFSDKLQVDDLVGSASRPF